MINGFENHDTHVFATNICEDWANQLGVNLGKGLKGWEYRAFVVII